MKLLFELFLQFAKIGLFTFGGGYAMLPLIERTCVEQKQWISEEEMLTITVVAESTPGPVAINCATYVGNKQKGIAGAVAATLGMIIPSFVIILILSFFFDAFIKNRYVAAAFKGIKVAVGILIIDAAVRLFKKLPKKVLPMVILCAAGIAMLLFDIFAVKISSVVLLLAGALIGITAYAITKRKTGGKEE